jgi:glutaryl-CoA dehydrogenase
MWIGNADVADMAIVWAKCGGDAAQDIRGFIVPMDREGVRVSLIENKMSLRIARTSHIAFDGVQLAEEDLLKDSGGLRSPLKCLDQARYGIAWGVLGAAEACLAEVLAYVSEREVFDKPLASYQLVQDKLAGMLTRLTECTGSCVRLAELKDAGTATSEQISMAKYSSVEMAQQTARTCRELLGAVGILDDFVAFRHMANLESVATYEGTRDIHRLVLGRHLTGVQAFR